MPPEPDKTLHEDLGLTSLSPALPQGSIGGAWTDDDRAEAEIAAAPQPYDVATEPVWTARRMATAACIAAVLAAEVAWAVARRDPYADRRHAIAALTESDKAALAAKYERFGKLPPAEQDRLRALSADFAADADAASLLATLDGYLQWKARLSPQQSAMLVGLNTEPRFERIKTWAAEQQAAASREFSDVDSKTVVAWLEKEVREHQDQLLKDLPGIVRERFESMGARERTWALMYYVLSSHRGPGPSRFDVFTPPALQALRGQLSPSAQTRWDAALKNPKDKDELKKLLADWIRRSIERVVGVRSDGPAPSLRVDERDLRTFFETELSETERQRLLALPHDEMQSQLRREYLRHKGLWKEPPGGRFGPFPRPYGSGDNKRPPSFRKLPEGDGPGKPPPGSPPADERGPPKRPGGGVT